MPDFQAGKWLIGLSIIMFAFIVFVDAVNGTFVSTGISSYDSVSTTDTEEIYNDLYPNYASCDGIVPIAGFLTGSIYCNQLEIDLYDNETCIEIYNCTGTDTNGICRGKVNKTAYNLTTSFLSGNLLCRDSNVLQENARLCQIFLCDYQSLDEYIENENIRSSIPRVFTTVKNLVLFRTDFKMGWFSFVFNFIFWLIFVAWLWAFYMSLR